MERPKYHHSSGDVQLKRKREERGEKQGHERGEEEKGRGPLPKKHKAQFDGAPSHSPSLEEKTQEWLRYQSAYKKYLFAFIPMYAEALEEEAVRGVAENEDTHTALSFSVFVLLAHGARYCEDDNAAVEFYAKAKQHLDQVLVKDERRQDMMRVAEGLWGMALFIMGDEMHRVHTYLNIAMMLCERQGAVNSPCYVRCLHGKFVLTLALDRPDAFPKRQEEQWLKFRENIDQTKKAPPYVQNTGTTSAADLPVSHKNLSTLDCILRIMITVVTSSHNLANEWAARKSGKVPCLLEFKSEELVGDHNVHSTSTTDNADIMATQAKLIQIIARLEDEISSIQSSSEPLPDNVSFMVRLHTVALFAMVHWAVDQHDEALAWARQYVNETKNYLYKLCGLGAILQIDIIVNVLDKLQQTSLLQELLNTVIALGRTNKHIGLMRIRIRNALMCATNPSTGGSTHLFTHRIPSELSTFNAMSSSLHSSTRSPLPSQLHSALQPSSAHSDTTEHFNPARMAYPQHVSPLVSGSALQRLPPLTTHLHEHCNLAVSDESITPTVERSSPPSSRMEDVNRECKQCQTRNTPEWRKGPDGPRTLCNACGLRWSRNNQMLKKQQQAASSGELFARFTLPKPPGAPKN